MRVGLLHPGLMGESIGASAQSAEDVQVLWASEGRSDASRQRAAKHDFEECETVADLVNASDVIVSVISPCNFSSSSGVYLTRCPYFLIKSFVVIFCNVWINFSV